MKKLIKELIVNMDISEVTPETIGEIKNLFAENTGNANLRIKIFDPSAGVVLPMVSRNIKVDVTTAVADYFDKRGIRYDLR